MHKLLDKITQKIIYTSAVRPITKTNPNHRLTEEGGEASTSKQPSFKVSTTVFIRSRQDDADPLKVTDPNWKCSKWNIQIEWETCETTFEPLSVIAADDPITCAAYAKQKNLYNLDGWKRFRCLIKKEKQLSRAIEQSKIRQVRHAKKYMFGLLIPRKYTEAFGIGQS